MKKEVISIIDEPKSENIVRMVPQLDGQGQPILDGNGQPVLVEQIETLQWTERRQVTELVDMTPEEIGAFQLENAPSLATYQKAVDRHLDSIARARGYEGEISLISYTTSTNAAWAAEANAFVTGRDAVWAHVLTLLDAVTAQQQAPPTLEDFIAGLPAINWPA